LFIFISSSSVKTGFGGLGPSQFSSTWFNKSCTNRRMSKLMKRLSGFGF
jgi:hypothetical protein